MSSYNELLALIDAYINQNGVQAITGQVLNGVLRAMVDQLGRGYAIMGAAQPNTDPGTPDAPESWFASTPGTYTNFDGLTVANAELALLSYSPTDQAWTKQTLTQGIVSTSASVDNNVGTPSVTSSYVNGVLTFTFQNLKGNPGQDGQDGDAAGFGTVSATVDGNVGTPGVSVQTSGPNTAKNMVFQFTNLKGETGVTSVVATVDNTSGSPACAVSLSAGVLTLAFTGLKGAQGDTGSSVDYPFTIVNNLTTNDATQALSAAMGVQLESEVSQLEAVVTTLAGKFYGVFDDESDLPDDATTVGYAFVGTDDPLALFTCDGETWTDTEIAIAGIVGPPGEPGIQGIQGIQGPPGVTSAQATVDTGTGTPSVEVSLNSGVLTFAFHNLKGLQGNTGSSVSYPFTLVNNLVTNDATQALTAAMGYMLGNEVFGPISDLTEVNQYDGYYIHKDTGELVAGASSSVTREYLVPDASYKYYATGKFGANANTCLVCYYKIDGTFISSQFPSTGTATNFDHQELTLPADCAKIRLFGSTPSPMPILSCVSGSLNQRLSSLEKMMGVLIAEEEDTRYTPYYINKDTGALVEGSVSSHVYEYDIEDPSIPYYASGRVGANTATCLVGYYTENGDFISSQYGSEGTAVIYEKQVLTVPSTCRKIRVFGFISTLGQQSYPPELWFGSRLPEKVNVIEERLNGYIADNVCKNTGKTVGVFGGSISVYAESQSAKDIWVKKLGVSITDYGVAGAGFSSLQGTTSIQAQVDGAASKDVYILWASTNDYRNNRECGTWSDYTAEDNYDSSKLVTQCGGINYCIKKLLTINPSAEIYFFTPLRFFSSEAGYNPFTDETNTTGKNFAEYIAEMKKCCDYYGIPVLDQFDLQGVNIFNKSLYYKTDNLHLNEAGYEKIGWVQADFLANGE